MATTSKAAKFNGFLVQVNSPGTIRQTYCADVAAVRKVMNEKVEELMIGESLSFYRATGLTPFTGERVRNV